MPSSTSILSVVSHGQVLVIPNGEEVIIHAHVVHRSHEFDAMPDGVRIALPAKAVRRCVELGEMARRIGAFIIKVTDLGQTKADWCVSREQVVADTAGMTLPAGFETGFLAHYDGEMHGEVYYLESLSFNVNCDGELFAAAYQKHGSGYFESAAIPLAALPCDLEIGSLSDEDLVGVLHAGRTPLFDEALG